MGKSKKKSRVNQTTKGRKTKGKKIIERKSFLPKVWMDILLIAVVAFITFSPALKNNFLDFDDRTLIYENPIILNGDITGAFTWNLGSAYYKPIVFLSWIVEESLFGFNAAIFHFNNILIHILNCFLIYLILSHIVDYSRVLKKYKYQVVFFTTILYGIHPLHVESVAWAVERKDVLFGFFFLLGLFSYIKYVKSHSNKWMFFTAISFLLSMMCKAPAITLVAVIFLYDYLSGRKLNRKIFLEKIPVFVTLLIGLWMYGILYDFNDYKTGMISSELNYGNENLQLASPLDQLLMMNFKSILWFLHALFPVKLSLGYPRAEFYGMGNNISWLHPLATLALGYLLWKLRYSSRLIVFCALFFIVVLSPAIVRNDFGTGVFLSDRYTYLPSLGLLLLMVGIIFLLYDKYFKQKRMFPFMLCTLLGLMYFLQSFSTTKMWENDYTLWSNTIKKYPTVFYAYTFRGKYLVENNRLDEALADYNKVLEIEPNNDKAYDQIGIIFRQQGKLEEALSYNNKAISLDPNNLESRINRGNTLKDLKRYQEALADFSAVLEKAPNNILALQNRGSLYGQLSMYDEALADFNKAIELNPFDKFPYKHKIYVYYLTNNYPEAIKNCDLYLNLDPGNQEILETKSKLVQLLNSQ